MFGECEYQIRTQIGRSSVEGELLQILGHGHIQQQSHTERENNAQTKRANAGDGRLDTWHNHRQTDRV